MGLLSVIIASTYWMLTMWQESLEVLFFTLKYLSLQQSCEFYRGQGTNLSKVTYLVVGIAEI